MSYHYIVNWPSEHTLNLTCTTWHATHHDCGWEQLGLGPTKPHKILWECQAKNIKNQYLVKSVDMG